MLGASSVSCTRDLVIANPTPYCSCPLFCFICFYSVFCVYKIRGAKNYTTFSSIDVKGTRGREEYGDNKHRQKSTNEGKSTDEWRNAKSISI